MNSSQNVAWEYIALSIAVPSGLAGLFLGVVALVTMQEASDERRLLSAEVRAVTQSEVGRALDDGFNRLNTRIDHAASTAVSDDVARLNAQLSALQNEIAAVESRLSARLDAAALTAKPAPTRETVATTAVDFDKQAEAKAALVGADVEKGKSLTRFCSACHTFDAGGANKVGPALYGVFGQKPGAVEGFAYSDAITALDQPWTIEALDAYLTKPTDFAPGTKMVFPGLRKEEWRRDVIAFLATLID